MNEQWIFYLDALIPMMGLAYFYYRLHKIGDDKNESKDVEIAAIPEPKTRVSSAFSRDDIFLDSPT